ncbi:hypothetical protein [Alteraurantiacibacter aquimixticola]|nr:hypothetical protein [Alteraurantiacibacter aquimixticola]
MQTNTLFHRAMAAIASIAVTTAILVSYFATPQVQATAGLLA